jgi:DNA-binding Lrp family transcriptional regulator
MDALAFRLLNEHQRGFPLAPRPYAEIAARAGTTEAEVLGIYRKLLAEGLLGRVGVVFRPNTVGASTLAALSVPAPDLERVAALVSAQPEVNHNYEREHRWNLWFVAAAASEAEVRAAIERIEAASGLKALRLPLEEEFHIDLGFDLGSGEVPRSNGAHASPAPLSPEARRLVAALEHGIPLVAEPYAELARAAGSCEENVIATLRDWLERGMARRVGTVVRHRPLGYRANAMVVWDVPDAEAGAAGRLAAAHPAVTLCYRRARQLPDWRYNFYCMVHGKERARAAELIEEVTRAAGLAGYAREVLFSARCFAQRGARYALAHG